MAHVAPYFRDPRVGAVQLLVRIRNRARWLCRFQNYEFLVFSSLTETAREKIGSVGLGGNGQFTRLAALMQLGDQAWTDCLTEDLDLGILLVINGWENRFCGETFVDQQGLASVPLRCGSGPAGLTGTSSVGSGSPGSSPRTYRR